MQPERRWRAAASCGALAALAGAALCRLAPSPAAAAPSPAAASVEARPPGDAAQGNAAQGVASPPAGAARAGLVELGRKLFFDTKLSEPPGTACASCHDPERAFSGDNGSTLGVPRGSRAGHFARRNAPSLLYLKFVPKFHYALDDDDAVKPVPFGGLFWDGRVDTVSELARQPLLNPDEMNGHDARTVAEKLGRASYAEEFRSAFGAPSPGNALDGVGQALEAFLTSDELAPFSSKFDAFARGRGKLSPYELEGMRLFKDSSKGGCVGCHRFYDTGRDPALSMFTDYGYDAVAVPRNDKLPSHKADLGLCERTDTRAPSNKPEYCVSFRTPSLRNVAVRGAYMHNGAFTSLRDVVSFYATRATDPKRWYKSGVKFEDVPAKYRERVNIGSIPYNRREGDVPALNDREIDAIVAFLRTLTDARYLSRAQ